ncbi:class I SAM-dependent methyltransferase [Bacillus sp. FJAT-49736]|nr:class I SAM-dependent methyltransferase [Bacillus sp. FJAT-49736]MBS4175811.1 class I SAM-dependent methyltransferase [Bacillus sp. FJAT-49736]
MENGKLLLNPSGETIQLLIQKAKEISMFITDAKVMGTYKRLVRYISNQSIKVFFEVNQYLDFNRESYRVLQNIYGNLLEAICKLANQKEITEKDINHLFLVHYKNLQAFLLESNGTEIFKKYRKTPVLFEVKCAEYTPEFQMKVLNINLDTIKQPVLDIGCGPQTRLVRFLRKNGIQAFGMDRNLNSSNYLIDMNWLECPFKPNRWGTIISHMAFSNHFTHHHLKADGNFERYAQKYMEILNSLKHGGSFIYAPGLSFIEEALMKSNKSFAVTTNEYSTKVTRLT